MSPNPDHRFSTALEFKAALLEIYRLSQQRPVKDARPAKKANLLTRIQKFFTGLLKRK